jgi:hypothetical protein
MSAERLREIVRASVPRLFAQIHGGRIVCESEATLQLHLGRIIATVADLEIASVRETFAIELEKPLKSGRAKRGRIDIWFKLTTDADVEWRCAIELKFFKKINQREPNNRYDVFKDIARLEHCADVADVGFMLVASDHAHYINHSAYSSDTLDFDMRHGKTYAAGTPLTYRTTVPYGPPITLAHDYLFEWNKATESLRYLLLEVTPDQPAVAA